MSNFKKMTLSGKNREELHDILELTGCEVSVNTLPAGVAVPFVHSHKNNEELYGVLSGCGELFIDGEVQSIAAGDWFRISPAGKRAIRAAADSPITFVCIQTQEGSLKAFTMNDGQIETVRAPWHES